MALDAERLAEYVDGVLSPADRAEVERHLADCAECRAMVADATSFGHSVAARQTGAAAESPRRRWLVAIGATLAAAAAIAVAIRLLPSATPTSSGGAALTALVAAVAEEPTRPVEGRLSGFPYAPAEPVTRGRRAQDVPANVSIAAAEVERAAETNDSADNQAALGVAYLAVGDVDHAVAQLERAAGRAPASARALNDLAVALLARASARGSTADDARAADLASRALSLEPRFAEAAFNRALALSRLGRPDAADAWRTFESIESDARWTAEAARRAAALPR